MGRICLARLVNYEDDPDLKAAMQYDSEYNGGDRDLASQSLAEQHYLRYLQRCREPSQRAKVYVQLGVLFATNWHGDKGEQPDYEKSVEYMKKALEEEPERVGSETIRARCFLLTPLHTRQEAMELRCQNYEWLLGVQAALGGEAKPEILLPDVPGEPLAAHRIGALKSLAVNVVSSEGYNLASTADSFPIGSIGCVILRTSSAGSRAQRPRRRRGRDSRLYEGRSKSNLRPMSAFPRLPILASWTLNNRA